MSNNKESMKWNASFYQDKHGFVAEYGKDLLKYIPTNNSVSILDLGCGTGALTSILHSENHDVIGIDGSPDMILKAGKNYPGIDFRVMDACRMPWENRFDIVFSNAVFHWIHDQGKLLSNIHRALKPGGILIAEMGAVRNIGNIQRAFEQAVLQYGYQFQSPFFFPSPSRYAPMLEHEGFHIIVLEDFDRPTPLNDGEKGLENWIRQFFSNDLKHFQPETCDAIIREIEKTLMPTLWNGTQWIADYRRLRIIAEKQVTP